MSAEPFVRSYDELLSEYVRERTDPSFAPVRIGYGTVDAETRGVAPGQVLTIAASTGTGKTWLLESIEHNVAARQDSGTLSLSLEMPAIEWTERAVAIAEGVSPEQVEAWAKQGEIGRNATGFLERMSRTLVAERVPADRMEEVIAEARERLDVPLRVLLIDYFGLLNTRGPNAYERASQAAWGLKALAKKHRLAVIVAAQLNRGSGNGAEPVTLDMIRDSGVIGEAADYVLGAWRPELKRDISPEDYFATRDVLRLAVLKNRRGQQGRDVDLRFDPDSRRLLEVADPFAAGVS